MHNIRGDECRNAQNGVKDTRLLIRMYTPAIHNRPVQAPYVIVELQTFEWRSNHSARGKKIPFFQESRP